MVYHLVSSVTVPDSSSDILIERLFENFVRKIFIKTTPSDMILCDPNHNRSAGSCGGVDCYCLLPKYCTLHARDLKSTSYTWCLWDIWACAWKYENKANLRDFDSCDRPSNWIQIVYFSARVTVKFDRRPRKTIGHFFYTTSSFVHHFKSIGEFKLDLQSRNAQFGSK